MWKVVEKNRKSISIPETSTSNPLDQAQSKGKQKEEGEVKDYEDSEEEDQIDEDERAFLHHLSAK